MLRLDLIRCMWWYALMRSIWRTVRVIVSSHVMKCMWCDVIRFCKVHTMLSFDKVHNYGATPSRCTAMLRFDEIRCAATVWDFAGIPCLIEFNVNKLAMDVVNNVSVRMARRLDIITALRNSSVCLHFCQSLHLCLLMCLFICGVVGVVYSNGIITKVALEHWMKFFFLSADVIGVSVNNSIRQVQQHANSVWCRIGTMTKTSPTSKN